MLLRHHARNIGPFLCGPVAESRSEAGRYARQLGFEIRHNGMPRTYRDRKDIADAAARFATANAPGDIIEI